MPLLNVVANTNITELRTLNLTLTATDSDLPTNTLTFALVSAPTGASVTASGLFAWTPTEAQGPGTNPITVKVSDNGSPSLSSTQSFNLVVFETNAPPVLAFINDQNATPGTQLIVNASATDPDLPTNTLSYSLSPGAPTGVTINPNTGVFTWTPATNQAPATNLVTVRVTDNGSPVLSDAKSFTIFVASTAPLRVTSVSMASNGALSLAWDSQSGKLYEVQYKDNLTVTNWSILGTYPATGSTTRATNNTAGAPQRYYRINQTN